MSPQFPRPSALIARHPRIASALAALLLATATGHAQAPERGPWALLWLAPQVPPALGSAVVEATASQLAGMGVVLRVERPRSQAARPPDGAEGALVLLVLRGERLREAELVVTDLVHGRSMTRSLSGDDENEGAMSEAAGLIAREAARAALAPEEPPPSPAPASVEPLPTSSSQPGAQPPAPTNAAGRPNAPPPESAPAEGPEGDAPALSTVSPPAAAPKGPAQGVQSRLSLGYSADLPSTDLGLGHGPDVALALRLMGTPWLARVCAGYRVGDTAELAQARMTVRRVPLVLAAGLRTALVVDRLWLQGTAGLDMTVWWRGGQSRDGFSAADGETRVRAGVQLGATLGLSLTPQWDLAARLQGSLYFNNFNYITEPGARIIANPAWLQPAATLELGFNFQ